uniref:Uncharacterized protein n=1 Tax=Tanacetum cinerariifolium TaxID=118510 RepID=A0A6L2N5F0_TANCI|nr:hypothetical protein [Tanacetum cinerariifolium]
MIKNQLRFRGLNCLMEIERINVNIDVVSKEIAEMIVDKKELNEVVKGTTRDKKEVEKEVSNAEEGKYESLDKEGKYGSLYREGKYESLDKEGKYESLDREAEDNRNCEKLGIEVEVRVKD